MATKSEGTKSKPCYRVIIIGAGIGGLAAAIGISKAGHDVVILERMPELREVLHHRCTLLRSQTAHDRGRRLELGYKFHPTLQKS